MKTQETTYCKKSAIFFEAPDRKTLLGLIKIVKGNLLIDTPLSEFTTGVEAIFLAGVPFKFKGVPEEVIKLTDSKNENHKFLKIKLSKNVFCYSYIDNGKCSNIEIV